MTNRVTDIKTLPTCKKFTPASGGYEGVWTTLFVKPLTWLIIQIGSLVRNYGVAVIIITLLIRLALYPITKKSAKQSELMKKASDDEAKVFYTKMKGDYNRYIAEYADGDLKKEVSDAALASYNEATDHAKNLPVLNPIGLGLALNFSVFYYEVMNDHAKAIQIASDALDKANKELPNIDEDAEENRDTVSIVNLLKENLDMWKSEEEGGDN